MPTRLASVRLSILVLIMAPIGFSEAALAQSSPFQCFANGGVSSPALAEGVAELVGDYVLSCVGGTSTPSGTTVPTVDIQVFLNTSLTSRLLTSPWSEAILLIDEPLPGSQLLCPGTCAITGNGGGGPNGVYNGTSGHPNVFQGHQTASNSITFSAVPIDPPGAGNSLTLRITNIRGNANALGLAGANATPTPLVETISPTPASGLPISNPSQTVAFIQQGGRASLSSAQVFSQCSSQNQALADDPTQSGTSQFSVTFQEQFATAFKKRNTATTAATPNTLANQNDERVGTYNTETGFYNSSFPVVSGQGNMGLAGLADQGTRLLVNFQNVPSGVSLFTPVAPLVTGPDILRLTNTDANGAGPFSPVVGNGNGLAPIALVERHRHRGV